MEYIQMELDPEYYLERQIGYHSIWEYLFCRFFWRHPRYEPERWNDGGTIQYNNNCYNYACNIRTNTFAQPGKASGDMSQSLICSEVKDGAISDGLKASTTVECGKYCHKVALFVWPGWDYHWYREDCCGKWSHKPGMTEATNLDNSGNEITDPRNADRGGYTEFCGFFCVCCGEVDIE